MRRCLCFFVFHYYAFIVTHIHAMFAISLGCEFISYGISKKGVLFSLSLFTAFHDFAITIIALALFAWLASFRHISRHAARMPSCRRSLLLLWFSLRLWCSFWFLLKYDFIAYATHISFFASFAVMPAMISEYAELLQMINILGFRL